jgi:hypothetical protein
VTAAILIVLGVIGADLALIVTGERVRRHRSAAAFARQLDADRRAGR